jgi:adenine-specific DNA-methyltransferase
MPRPRKNAESETDAAKMRDIEAYTHDDKKRANNPPVGMAQHDKAEEKVKTYQFDPHLDPTLQWAGKAEGTSFDVPTSSIHIHESIKPFNIIAQITKAYSEAEEGQLEGQVGLFAAETPAERMRRRREAIEFYQHGVDWTNRMIAGDSLVIMNSLLEKEGMAGQVQMVYIDPPYGIKYGSNFQPFVDKRDVKDKKDEDLTQEPEMIKAFRDTWELGIHSYLTYLRNRLLLARELLTDSGSVFVQISDENVHLIRCVCDDVFGVENFVTQILYKKTTGAGSPNELSAPAAVGDYIVWYAKNRASYKFHTLFKNKIPDGSGSESYTRIELYDKRRMSVSEWEKQSGMALTSQSIPEGAKLFTLSCMTSQSGVEKTKYPVHLGGKVYTPDKGVWKTSQQGMDNLLKANRVMATSRNDIRYVRYFDDFPCMPITNLWDDCGMADKIYVVQTALKAIQRCMLMTTDPGDLVLDITCGSGTTAYVAEQWGRRWITCDTSRVAITLAKQRLMTATFDYYKLAHPEQGVGSGFIYKTVPHITLKSIANNEPPATETLYDQPEIDKTKIRVTGPFTVEALPAPVVKPLDDLGDMEEDVSAKQTDWRDQLLATGILGRGGAKLEFSRVEPLSGTKFLQAEAETKEDTPRRAVICFAGESKPLDSRMVAMALDEAEALRPAPKLIIFAAFQFDPEAAKDISETNWPGVTLLQTQMNTDLMTEDLKKKRSSDQSFWLVGQPDVELIRDGRSKTRYKVRVNGFDYYDVKKGTVESGSTSRIAMWMLDTDYDGMCIVPKQVFFPMGGKKDGWNKLAKTLRAEIDPDLIEKFAGNESLWFTVQPNSRIAVKIIDDRGIESLKVIRVGED